VAAQVLCLPIYPALELSQVEHVVSIISSAEVRESRSMELSLVK